MKSKIFVLIIFIFGILAIKNSYAPKDNFLMKKRMQMVDEQIAARGVSDPKVLKAMRKVERHLFVPQDSTHLAYEDHPLPIGKGQTISQPYIVAFMTEQAEITPQDKVLEIGTGSGYQAAILGEIAQDVYSVEIIESLAKEAQQRLAKLGYKNIHIKHGDGYQGWEEHAPYDAIIVTAAPPEIPEKLIEQLKIGGRMVIPVGDFYQKLKVITKTQEKVLAQTLISVRFVPMVHSEK